MDIDKEIVKHIDLIVPVVKYGFQLLVSSIVLLGGTLSTILLWIGKKFIASQEALTKRVTTMDKTMLEMGTKVNFIAEEHQRIWHECRERGESCFNHHKRDNDSEYRSHNRIDDLAGTDD